ncbi:unnamed protein product [Miscanthus lutarioriparius]|uniref:SWIM-type domain-containing protein n=1 Tax=Miscanthus lutarioriparius TaxID=422564 RepID=A0A811Q192_9POAL|nr:unnamed protein product [Miscanthus lutarioriparius]
MEKWYIRKKIARQWEDGILLGVLKDLNAISKILKVVKVATCDDGIVEVIILDDQNNQKRHTMDFENHKCSCREWQITGKPCKHALAWICPNRGVQISDYVYEYYSVAKFRAA